MGYVHRLRFIPRIAGGETPIERVSDAVESVAEDAAEVAGEVAGATLDQILTRVEAIHGELDATVRAMGTRLAALESRVESAPITEVPAAAVEAGVGVAEDVGDAGVELPAAAVAPAAAAGPQVEHKRKFASWLT